MDARNPLTEKQRRGIEWRRRNNDEMLRERRSLLEGSVQPRIREPPVEEPFLNLLFESDREVERFNLEYVCGYLGLPHQNAHRAKEDVLATGAIIMRFLKLHRRLLTSGKIKFKNSFVEKTID